MSVSFGPTNYFDIDEEVRLSSRRLSMSRETSPTMRSHISSSQSARATTTSRQPLVTSEVTFYAGEDLYRDSVVGTRELAIKKYCKCKLEFDETRTFESYCFEFCGVLNLKIQDLKFMLNGSHKEIAMMRTVKKPSEILVYYWNKQLPNRA